MARVSIIIPFYNVEEYIEECIKSVLDQTFKDFEIILVNDGSFDGSDLIVRRFLEKDECRIKYIIQENKGLAGARNVGIRNSSSEFVAFLDADDMLFSNSLELRMSVISENKDVGLVYGNATVIEGNKIVPMTIKDLNGKYVQGNVLPQMLERNYVIMPTVMVRSEVFKTCGYFDESLKRIEDYDMWLRIAKKNYLFAFVDHPVAYYRIRKGALSQNRIELLSTLVSVYDKFSRTQKLTKSEDKIIRKSRKITVKELNYRCMKTSILEKKFNDSRKMMFEIVKSDFLNPKHYLTFMLVIAFPQLFRRLIINKESMEQNSYYA